MPAICNVSGTVVTGGGGAIPDSPVRAQLREGDDPKFVDGTGELVSDGSVSTRTDGNGYFVLPLIQGLTYVINIVDANYHKQVTIPNSATANLEDL